MLHPILLLFVVALSLSTSPSTAATAAARSAHEVLRSHGLPIGLLPKGIREFRLEGDGRFEVHLESPCTAKFETAVQYDATITGTLTYGQMAAVSGVSAQELFLWFPVNTIRVDVPSSGLIYFDVGVIYKQFSLSLFETPPDCAPIPSPPFQGRSEVDDLRSAV